MDNNYINEKKVKEIFQTQYNDIFHNILKYDKNKMMMLLQEQLYLHLKIINKVTDFSIIQHMFSLFQEKYSEDKKKVFSIYQIIKNNPTQIIYLDYLNCFIHCIKCRNALHKCGKNLIVNNDYVFCLECLDVYNEFQVNMYCKECKVEYYTKLREIKNKNETYATFIIFYGDNIYGFLLCELAGDIYDRGEHIAIQLGKSFYINEMQKKIKDKDITKGCVQ